MECKICFKRACCTHQRLESPMCGTHRNDLSQEEYHWFIEDLVRSAKAVEKVFAPLKMSLDMGSSGYPHLYCRLKPRYYGDTAAAHMAERILPSHEYAMYVSELKAALTE